ncbi:DUF6375 family protein [Metapseudomonas otitidis]|uniref:DUF6375 family protein n=1 Tax=Metapseudomonas otitidis TaxID=319939 RepID=UPI00227BE21D|nr:DUF6375 family protein [Pseudomonas otitidis]WAF87157.1 DUF6375 family protein [Pseudomonas otitidis]
MKIWSGYGSEHSMNLVLIGKFKRAQDAEKTEKEIDKLKAQAAKDDSDSIPFAKPEDQRFSDDMLSLLYSLSVHSLAPNELGQLVSDYRLKREGGRITVTTDEADVSAFLKLFIEAGAKVEVFSAHDYPSDSADAS